MPYGIPYKVVDGSHARTTVAFDYAEQELKAMAYEHGLTTRIHGKDVVAAHGEYVPEVVLAAVEAGQDP